MKRTYEQSINAPPLRRDDINYPGALPLVAKSQARTTVDYDTYVLRYAAAQRANGLLLFAGVAVIIAAVMWTPAPMVYFVSAIGLGMTAGGAIGLLSAMSAHREYREIAVSVTETYAQPAPRPELSTVRPFVSSDNGTGRTTNTGRLDFTPEVWRNLFNRALKNGGEINRDDVAKPALSREWYHGAGYGALLRELSHMGFIDERKRLTPAALSWYEQQIALPLDAIALRSPFERTNGRTDDTNEGDRGGVGGVE